MYKWSDLKWAHIIFIQCMHISKFNKNAILMIYLKQIGNYGVHQLVVAEFAFDIKLLSAVRSASIIRQFFVRNSCFAVVLKSEELNVMLLLSWLDMDLGMERKRKRKQCQMGGQINTKHWVYMTTATTTSSYSMYLVNYYYAGLILTLFFSLYKLISAWRSAILWSCCCWCELCLASALSFSISFVESSLT